MPKETGASARPAVKATSRKLQNAKFKQPLVMPPADDSTPREDIPDVDLAVFLHLAAKFKVYAKQVELTKACTGRDFDVVHQRKDPLTF